MKQITYAGEALLTTDEVASALVSLTAAMAMVGRSEAVEIPICDATGEDCRTAELVIGQGNDVLAVPIDFEGTEPDFSAEARRLADQMHTLTKPSMAVSTTEDVVPSIDDFDYDFPTSPAYFESDNS